ncbi:unnamed protein product [Prunus armeniaca]
MGVKTRPAVSSWVAPPDPLRQTSRWLPPQVNFLKINFDGAWQLNSFKAALVAEAAAGLCAIKYAISRGYRKIILEKDSKVLVKGTRGASNNGLWAVKPLLDEYDKLSSFFSDVKWNWVPRHLNRAAHKAAAIGARAVQLDCWAVRPPPSLVGVLVSDGLPCPPVEVSAQ